MPLPTKALDLIDESITIGDSLTSISTAIAALPATPLEADLPDIVQIMTDLNAAATSMQAIVSQVLDILSTTRVNQ